MLRMRKMWLKGFFPSTNAEITKPRQSRSLRGSDTTARTALSVEAILRGPGFAIHGWRRES
jgi:hypothetical protein